MIIIYDFDGTLTPYSFPQYEILKKCGYNDDRLIQKIKEEIQKGNATEIYDAYYKCYIDILSKNGIAISKDTACLGANQVAFNPDKVLEGEELAESLYHFAPSISSINSILCSTGLNSLIAFTAVSISTRLAVAAMAVAIF